MFDACTPWSGASYWWHLNPVLDVTKRAVDIYYASLFAALRFAALAELPTAAAYPIALPLLGWFALRPAATAAEVWSGWMAPNMLQLQAISVALLSVWRSRSLRTHTPPRVQCHVCAPRVRVCCPVVRARDACTTD